MAHIQYVFCIGKVFCVQKCKIIVAFWAISRNLLCLSPNVHVRAALQRENLLLVRYP